MGLVVEGAEEEAVRPLVIVGDEGDGMRAVQKRAVVGLDEGDAELGEEPVRQRSFVQGCGERDVDVDHRPHTKVRGRYRHRASIGTTLCSNNYGMSFLAVIPSPDSGSLALGPLELRAYGLMIAIGVIAAVLMARRRWAAVGGDPDLVDAMALRAVPAGLLGARAYHVLTDWKAYDGRWLDALKIWEGGLGIPGGLVAGMVVAVIYLRRQGIDIPRFADAAIPGIPLAQAIGRLGNWFNQELFGRPTDLPWALAIDADKRPEAYAAEPTFHPTFLYEGLWNLGLMAVLLWYDRRGRHAPGELLWIYVAGYGLGRLAVESLRIDQASLLAGVRVNIWTASAAVIVGVIMAVRTRRIGSRQPMEDGEPVHRPLGDGSNIVG